MEKEQGLLYTAETKTRTRMGIMEVCCMRMILTTNQHQSFESDLPEGTYSFAALSGATNCCFWGNDLTYGFGYTGRSLSHGP